MTCVVDKIIAGINANNVSSKGTVKKLEAKLNLVHNRIVSLADLSATVWDKETCLAEHDHLENCNHCWFKDKIKGLESKAEADIEICMVNSPEGEKFASL